MANLPEPDWITLFESTKRAVRAFSSPRASIETALTAAFHDWKIRTRGRCRSYFNDDWLHNLARYTWDRADVDWKANEFTILDDRLGRKLHIFLDVVVFRDDLEEWINGTMPDEPVENLTPETPGKEEKPRSRRKRDAGTDAISKKRYEKVVAKARRQWPGKHPSTRVMAEKLVSADKNLAEKHTDKLGFKFSTVRKILDGTYKPAKRQGVDRF